MRIGRKTLVIGILLCFGLCGPAISLSQATAEQSSGGHQVVAEHDASAVTAHEGGTAGHQVEEGHGSGSGESHGKKNSLSKEKLMDLMWRVINFAALLFILIKFGAKPVGSALSGRKKQIQEEIEDLENKRAEAERSFREFESKLAGMEGEISTIVEKAVAQAESEKVRIIESAHQAADDIKRQAQMAIQNELVSVRRSLKNDIADQATAMAEEIIVKSLKPEDQSRIIEDYLNKVGTIQ